MKPSIRLLIQVLPMTIISPIHTHKNKYKIHWSEKKSLPKIIVDCKIEQKLIKTCKKLLTQGLGIKHMTLNILEKIESLK